MPVVESSKPSLCRRCVRLSVAVRRLRLTRQESKRGIRRVAALRQVRRSNNRLCIDTVGREKVCNVRNCTRRGSSSRSLRASAGRDNALLYCVEWCVVEVLYRRGSGAVRECATGAYCWRCSRSTRECGFNRIHGWKGRPS